MAEVITPPPPLSLPGSPLALPDRTVLGRPLSEISDNEPSSRSRTVSRSSMPNLLDGAPTKRPGSRPLSEVQPNTASRPNSEIAGSPDLSDPKESKEGKKRSSAPLPVHTITLNLNQYAASLSNSPKLPLSPSAEAPPPPSPSTKPAPPKVEKPIALRSPSLKQVAQVATEGEGSGKAAKAEKDASVEEKGEESRKPDDEEPAPHPLLAAQRALLKPSSHRPTLAEPIPESAPSTLSAPSVPSAKSSFDSPRSSGELPPLISLGKPPTKAKPSWLRRASGTAGFRSKSKTPPPKEDGMTASTSLPPALPPRKGGAGLLGSSTSTSISDKAGSMGPPELPARPNTNAAAGPSRSRLAGGEGQPAYLPPPPPVRDPAAAGGGNIRGRIAAWGNSGFSRSESSSSLSFSAPSAFASAQQKLGPSAQKFMGQAGSAVSKGLAGLRARGVGGSISNISSLAGPRRASMEQLATARGGKGGDRERSVSANTPGERIGDGPFFPDGAVLRVGGDRTGRVFGRNISEAGRAWGVVDANQHIAGRSEWESRRRACLPALVVRAVEYLWGPKEEGIFRISGRSSHITRLRKDFDSGADIDLTGCDPGDLDPHAVSGIFKSYLRELPEPVLTHMLTPKFEATIKAKLASRQGDTSVEVPKHETVTALMQQLPAANWFLVADIIKLLDLIPRHTATNRMSLNSIMLSLGPSLNLPGPVLTELLERREELFLTPPPLSSTDALTDMIDFGDTMIAPPMIPAAATEPGTEDPSRSATPVSVKTTESFGIVSGEPKKKSPKRLSSKPSLARLFSGSGIQRSSAELKAALDAPRTSVVDNSPPRVDVPLDSPQLPTFEEERRIDLTEAPPKPVVPAAAPEEPQTAEKGGKRDSVPEQPKEESVRPPSGTPIADMFSGTSTQLLPLRSSSALSSPILTNSPLVRGSEWTRRPSAAFFSSSERHVRSQSANTSPVVSQSATMHTSATFNTSLALGASVGVGAGASGSIGTKRKEEAPGAVGEEGRTKRLSAGPGVLN